MPGVFEKLPRSDLRPSFVPDEMGRAAKSIVSGLAQPHDVHLPQ